MRGPDRHPRVDTTLPYTRRLPEPVAYDGDPHALVCYGCERVYDPDSAGMQRVIECCPDGEVDPDDVPICAVNLKLSKDARVHSGYTDAQLMFLQAV